MSTPKGQIEKAIDTKAKILFRMKDTAVGKFILFHPYAVLHNVLTDKISVYGLIEKHYATDTQTDYLENPSLDNIDEVVVTQEKYTLNKGWDEKINKTLFDIIYPTTLTI